MRSFQRKKHGISSTVAIAAIVVLVIVAAAGWATYAAYPMTKTLTTTVGAQTVTVSTGGGANLTKTVTTTASGGTQSGNATGGVFGQPTTSSVSFTMATLAGVSNFAIFGVSA